nr:uroporphyrinogen III synthase [Hymenolepis microstoma]
MDVILLKSTSEDAYTRDFDPYVKILKQNNIHVDLIETITFSYCGCLFERLCKWRSSFSCIVFCSPRAVSAFASTNLIGVPEDLCFAVGPATSDAARKVGFCPKGSHTGNAEKLANFIIDNHLEETSKNPVLLLVGAKHSSVLTTKLREFGLSVEEVVVYNSIPNPDFGAYLASALKSRENRPLCLVFFSPSGVELAEPVLKNFLDLFHSNIRVVAIGPTTAARIENARLPLTGICESPTPESLLKCLQQLLP